MAMELVFLSGEREGERFAVGEAELWLGRDPRCQLAFDPDKHLVVSGWHARLNCAGSELKLHDNSTNGTLVNGQPISGTVVLHAGDIVELGPGGPKLQLAQGPDGDDSPGPTAQPRPAAAEVTPNTETETLEVMDDPLPQAGDEPSDCGAEDLPAQGSHQLRREAKKSALDSKTSDRNPPDAYMADGEAVTSPARSPRESGLELPLTSAVSAADPHDSALRLVVRRLPEGKPLEFCQQMVRLGRDPTADVALDVHRDLLVSHNHAKIVALSGVAVLFDSDSTNGTFVDDQRISRHDLRDGEVIQLGQGGPRLEVVSVTRTRTGGQPTFAGSVAKVSGETVFAGGAPELTDLSLGKADLLVKRSLHQTVTIGRDQDNDIVLDSMFVSAQHATVNRHGDRVLLEDLASANGTYLAGERIAEAELGPGVEFTVGPYVLKFSGDSVLAFDTRSRTWAEAVELTRTDRRTGHNFLDRVSLRILPGEFVCVLGPSGSGKSTLLKALNGEARADRGQVFLNNIDFYKHYQQLKHRIGYVPQDDIIHTHLTVWRTLHYAARLRLPPGVGRKKRKERIEDVLSVLELYDHRHKPIWRLSGGQRKRVSIAVELLTDPAIIFLDEPTSGLDPNLEEKMMLLLREMTLQGKTVAAVTHTLDNIHLADKVAFLVDGKMVFYGSPNEGRRHFRVQRLPEVYKRFDERHGNIETLRAEYENSDVCRRHAGTRRTDQEDSLPPARKGAGAQKRVGPGPLRQLWTLSARYAELITRDIRNTAILLIQAPLVALFIVLALRTDQPERGPTSTVFLIMSLAALWFGCSNAAREITKEASIFARERMVNLGVVPYVVSKFLVLQFVALIQVAVMLGLVHALRSGFVLDQPPPACTRWGIEACRTLILSGVPGDFGAHLLNLYLTALNGIGLGLLVSALAGNSDKAMSLVPLVLIPQVLFSGSFGVPPPDAHVKRTVGYVMSLNWSLDQAKRIAVCTPEQEKPTANPGVGCTNCLHGYDPFKHRRLGVEAQDDDAHCRAVLPVVGQMTDFPEHLELVEDGLYTRFGLHGKGKAREANRSRVGLYVQGGTALLLLILVCLTLRRRYRSV